MIFQKLKKFPESPPGVIEDGLPIFTEGGFRKNQTYNKLLNAMKLKPKLSDFILLLGLSIINIKNYEFIILTYWISINNSVISWNNHNSLLYKRLKSLSLDYYLVQIENRSI